MVRWSVSKPEPRPAGRDAQRLERPDAGQRPSARTVARSARAARTTPRPCAVDAGTAHPARRRPASAPRRTPARRPRPRPSSRTASSPGSATSASAVPGSTCGPGRLAVVDQVRGRARRGRAATGSAPRSATPGARCSRCWVVSECSQVSRSGPDDADHRAVRQVDRRLAGRPARAARGTGRRSARRRPRPAGRRRRRPVGRAADWSSGTSLAAAEDREVPTSVSKPCCSRSRPDQRVGHVDVGLGHRAAVAADQVEVVVAGRRVVGRRTVTEVGVGDQAELLEQLEGAVDGRDVDAAAPSAAPRRRSRRACRARARRRLRARAGAAGSAGSPWPGGWLVQVGGRSSGRSAPASGSPTGAAAAAGRPPPCRRPTAGRRRPGRRAGARRCTPWRSRCGRRRRSAARSSAPSTAPSQISTKPVGWASSSSSVPSASGRQ